MIATKATAPQPEVLRMVEEILLENSRYDRDLRSYHREVLVSPVVLRFVDSTDEDQHCVSRNISAAGIALISSFPIENSAMANMELYRLAAHTATVILAECRWCKAYGPSYWMSGWQFVHLLGS